jgi:hypothetical protein
MQANDNERNFGRAQKPSLRNLYRAAGSASGFPGIDFGTGGRWPNSQARRDSRPSARRIIGKEPSRTW